MCVPEPMSASASIYAPNGQTHRFGPTLQRSADPVSREMSHVPERRAGFALCVIFGIQLVLLLVGCGQVVTSTPTSLPRSLPTTVTSPPGTPTGSGRPTSNPSVVAPTRPAASLTPTVQPLLKTETIRYSGALSVEDLNTLMLDLRTLPGVADVQGGMQDLQVTYDPNQVSRQKIVERIESHGYSVGR